MEINDKVKRLRLKELILKWSFEIEANKLEINDKVKRLRLKELFRNWSFKVAADKLKTNDEVRRIRLKNNSILDNRGKHRDTVSSLIDMKYLHGTRSARSNKFYHLAFTYSERVTSANGFEVTVLSVVVHTTSCRQTWDRIPREWTYFFLINRPDLGDFWSSRLEKPSELLDRLCIRRESEAADIIKLSFVSSVTNNASGPPFPPGGKFCIGFHRVASFIISYASRTSCLMSSCHTE